MNAEATDAEPKKRQGGCLPDLVEVMGDKFDESADEVYVEDLLCNSTKEDSGSTSINSR